VVDIRGHCGYNAPPFSPCFISAIARREALTRKES
jgi:hypothetical protein